MVRVVKEYDERQAEFLDVAQQLFYRQGYGQTSVQQIIDAVGVAKGTFYHYFDSKAALLDELVERMVAQTLVSLEPLVADPDLGAIEKFETFFDQIQSWKRANRALMLDVARVLYRDENVLLRIKMQRQAVVLVAPLLARIIRQGIDEGVFDMAHPEEAAEILMRMGQGLSEAVMALMLGNERDEEAVAGLARKVRAYNRSVERVLGAEEGSLHLLDVADIADWLQGPNQ